MAIHNRVRKIRKSLGFTQKQLADALSISAPAYHYRESGKRSFRAEEIEKIACLMNVEPAIFFTNRINEMRNGGENNARTRDASA